MSHLLKTPKKTVPRKTDHGYLSKKSKITEKTIANDNNDVTGIEADYQADGSHPTVFQSEEARIETESAISPSLIQKAKEQ